MRADHTADLIKVVEQVKRLAARYYRLTGKPLGVTGEIGEVEVARLLGLKLAKARTPGYDAKGSDGRRRYQIKSRSLNEAARKKLGGRVGSIKLDKEWDAALLAIMDEDFDVLEIWEADRAKVKAALEKGDSKAKRVRGQLSLREFKRIGRLRYPVE